MTRAAKPPGARFPVWASPDPTEGRQSPLRPGRWRGTILYMTDCKCIGQLWSVSAERGEREVARLGSGELVDSVRQVSPDLATLLVDAGLGAVLGRPDLDLRTRELLAVALLAAQGAEGTYLAVHIRAALNAGAEPAELVATMMQVATFAGFPHALTGVGVLQQELRGAGAVLPVAQTARAVVTEFLGLLASGDVDGAVQLCRADAVWSIPGDPALLPWVGIHTGIDAIRRFYETLATETSTRFLTLGEVVGHAGQCFVRGEFGYDFPRNGGSYTGAFVIVFTVAEGQITHYEMHEDSQSLARSFTGTS